MKKVSVERKEVFGCKGLWFSRRFSSSRAFAQNELVSKNESDQGLS